MSERPAMPALAKVLGFIFIFWPILVVIWVFVSSEFMPDGLDESLLLHFALLFSILPRDAWFIFGGVLWFLLLVTGIAFLRVQPWARLALQFFCWLIMAYLVADCLLLARDIWRRPFPDERRMIPGLVTYFVFASLPVIAAIWILRSRRVRECFALA